MSLADLTNGAPTPAPNDTPAAAAAPVAPAQASSDAKPVDQTSAQPAVEQKTEPKPDPATKRIASLSRELEAARRELATVKPKASKFDEIETKVKADPRAVIDAYGLTFKQLVDAVAEVDDLPKDPVQEIQARLDLIEAAKKAEEEARTKAEHEAQVKARDAQAAESLKAVDAMIKAGGERFELVAKVDGAAQAAMDSVIGVIEANPDKEFPSEKIEELLKDALDALEAHYMDLGQKFSKQAKQAASSAATQSQDEPMSLADLMSQMRPAKPSTISSDLSQGGSPSLINPGKVASRDEVLREAKAALGLV